MEVKIVDPFSNDIANDLLLSVGQSDQVWNGRLTPSNTMTGAITLMVYIMSFRLTQRDIEMINRSYIQFNLRRNN